MHEFKNVKCQGAYKFKVATAAASCTFYSSAKCQSPVITALIT